MLKQLPNILSIARVAFTLASCLEESVILARSRVYGPNPGGPLQAHGQQ